MTAMAVRTGIRRYRGEGQARSGPRAEPDFCLVHGYAPSIGMPPGGEVVRDELFEQILPFVEGRYATAEGDAYFPATADPLERFKLSLGDAPLAPTALTAAAALARNPQQYSTIQRNAMVQLRDATDERTNSIAIALASLPPEVVTVPLEILASHPSHWLRALAAVIWAKRTEQPEEIGVALAQDWSRDVRWSLAGSLRKDARHQGVRAILSSDPRRPIRHRLTSDAV